MYILQIKNFLNAISHTVRTVSDNLDTSCKKLDDLVDKVCDIATYSHNVTVVSFCYVLRNHHYQMN